MCALVTGFRRVLFRSPDAIMSSTGCSTLPNCASVARNRRSCGSPRCSRSGDTAVTDPVETLAKAVQPQADPANLVLRAAPGRVARFRRGAIIAIAAAGSTAIVGVAWLDLKPATLNLVAADDDRTQLPAKAPADALAGAPTS